MAQDTIRALTPKSAAKAIEAAILARKPILILGGAGIGKSDIVHQIAKKQNRKVKDIRLALYDPTDIKGMPYFDSVDKTMKWAPPIEFPTDPSSTDILFLDELPSAPPAVQAAAYQLILNRQVGEYRLPDGVDIVAAGNRASDRGVVYKMPAPLINRFTVNELKVDFESFFDWAIENNVHKDVVGYLSHCKQDLSDFDPNSATMAFASPRSWKSVSDYLYKCADNFDEETILDLISGTIGDGLALKFNNHRKIASQLPLPKDILNGKVKSLKVKDVSALYSLVVSLCYELKELFTNNDKDFHKYVDTYLEWVSKNLTKELVVMGMIIFFKNYKIKVDYTKLKNWVAFRDEFGGLITNVMTT